ncbi:MAG: flagellar basal body-associated FliL family protein [Gemmatimonadaceae bacterium]|nr:flagellar basal body-associated FliL family protein [Gemmatimonadaceae bacterium]
MSQEPETTDAAPAPAKGGKKLLIGAIAGGALAGLSAGAFGIAPALSAKPADATEAHAADTSDAHGADTVKSTATRPVVINNLIVNPAESRGSRFLLASVGFEFAPAMSDDEFQLRETEVRDRILTVLARQTLEVLVDYARRDAIRAEVRAAVDSVLGAGRTKRVLFPQFVIQ